MIFRKYWQVVKMHWQLRMEYRVNVILETSGNLLTILITLALWLFAFNQADGDTIGSYTKVEMVSYLLIAGIITSTLWHTTQGDAIIRAIKQGRVSKYLVRPISLTMNNLIANLVDKVLRFTWSAAIALIFLFLFRDQVGFVLDFSKVPMFMLFLALALGIQYFIFYNAALLAFWLDEVWGITFTIRVFADVAAGTFIPLSLFAPVWQRIFDFLPFKYIIFVPVNALLGQVAPEQIVPLLLSSIGWFATLVIMTKILWIRGIRHYSAIGG